MTEIILIAKRAKKASTEISRLTTQQKNNILKNMAETLDKNRKDILEANAKDIKNAEQKDMRPSLIDRLELNNTRIDQITSSIKELIKQKDYIGDIITKKTLKNSLKLTEKRVPFGVIGVIYESRPNVTCDVSALCLKSSSAAILKGGTDAINTNKAIVKLLTSATPIKDAFQLIESSRRQATEEMLKLEKYIDLIIPRGGKNLIDFVRLNSKIPLIETGSGNCHIYADKSADIDQAIKIITNAKTQRPGVCNAAEKLLVHIDIAKPLLKKLNQDLKTHNVEIRGCKETQKIIKCIPATEDDWRTEYLDLVIAIRIVPSLEQAITHINRYGTKHTEAIISKDDKNIETFFDEIDASAVYSNASTRFTDGSEFGMGAEIGISTQKLHARGPMGLKALTTTKYLIKGNGQVRD